MEIRKLGHSCLLLEHDGRRILLDPGNFSQDWHPLTDLDAILVTHQHPDHLDTAFLPGLLEANPQAVVVSDEESAAILAGLGATPTVARAGQTLDVAGLPVLVAGARHAVIHPDVPGIANVGYVIAGLFHPGDQLTVPGPDAEIRVVAVPLSAPWSKLSETVEFLRALGAPVAVPIHDAILSAAGAALYSRVLGGLAPETPLHPIDGETAPVSF